MRRTVFVLTTALFVARPLDAAAEPRFVPLGHLGSLIVDGEARAVSDDGSVVVGVSRSPSGREAFRWTAETGIVGLGDFDGGEFESAALGVSGDGSVVVGQGRGAARKEAFRWTHEMSLVGLGDLEGGNAISTATAVSGDGLTVVGSSWGTAGIQAVRWDFLEGPFSLGQLLLGPSGVAWSVSADGSVIVGDDRSRVGGISGVEGFRWTESSGMVGLGDLPGGACCSEARDVSADGSTIVGRSWSSEGVQAVRWTEEEGLVALDDLPGAGNDGLAYATSGDGSVIVGRGSTALGGEAFLWTETDGTRNLQELAEAELGLDLTGWKLQEARDITPDGSTVVGWGWNPAGRREGWLLRLFDPVDAVEIDIRPGLDINLVTAGPGGILPVAILGSESFDVTAVDVVSLVFGPDGAAPLHDLRRRTVLALHRHDVDGDGLEDLVTHYRNGDTGLLPEDVEACITGTRLDGNPFVGCDGVVVTPRCGAGVELVAWLPGIAWLRRRRRATACRRRVQAD